MSRFRSFEGYFWLLLVVSFLGLLLLGWAIESGTPTWAIGIGVGLLVGLANYLGWREGRQS